jgi:urease accessory protein UreE
VAWQVGNLHFPIALRAGTILVEDDAAVRQMFERERIHFQSVREVFQPLGGAAGHHHH